MKKKTEKKIVEKKKVEKTLEEYYEEYLKILKDKLNEEFNEEEGDVMLSIGACWGDSDTDADALMSCSDDDTVCIDQAIERWAGRLYEVGVRTISIRFDSVETEDETFEFQQEEIRNLKVVYE
jgi:hypothetical protein